MPSEYERAHLLHVDVRARGLRELHGVCALYIKL